MHSFHNAPDTLVEQMIAAQLAIAPLTRLACDSGARILVREGWSPESGQVALISGGGAGHEPAHSGFIGRGMLTAAVIGELFASPSVGAIEQAIDALCGAAGCLLIVKNYTGDRLNFGLAAERARARGLAVEIVLVADDVALPGTRQPRGIAGTLLVHKIAGFHAERGASLAEVAQAAREAAAGMRTIGLALGAAHLPGKAPRDSQPALGLGIHNEPGARSVAPTSAAEAVAMVLEGLEVGDGQKRWIALLNDLGGCSPQERLVLADEVLDQIGIARITRLVGPAALMSALDMHGFSLTLLDSSPALIEALDAPVEAPAWPGAITPRRAGLHAAARDHSGEPGAQPDASQRNAAREALIRAVAERLLAARDELDRLDAHSGDGDAGSTFASGATALLEALEAGTLPSAEDAALLRRIAALLEARMGGSSGVLLSILFTAGAARLAAGDGWLAALDAGVERMRHHGGAELNDRTLLDALIPALAALGEDQGMAGAAAAARRGAKATAKMQARAGRAAQVPEAAQRGHADPGAEAIALVFEALAAASPNPAR